MKLKNLQYLYIVVVFVFFPACKKGEELPIPSKILSLSIEPSQVNLAKDEPFGKRLELTFHNNEPAEDLSVVWSSENPRIADVNIDGVVWPKGAGETYVIAKLISGKGQARCKVTITDGYDYKYRLVLKDKGTSDLNLNSPEAFLSAKAIERRRRQNIELNETDLPISADYLRIIAQVGGKIVAKSKWLNTVSVHCQDQFLIDQYKALPFVKEVILVWQGKRSGSLGTEKYKDIPQTRSPQTEISPLDYGTALNNISVNNGQYVHDKGYTGAGIDIAVIDAGFINLKNNAAFKNLSIKGAKSFVFENDDPYSIDSHGIWVTSCLAANVPGYYVGTAPEANYWLLRTEDQSSEYPIEEDYWVNAAEYADSAGVDIINSSLSYSTGYTFLSEVLYTFKDMDGKTALASRGANMAASKGILIVNCAGNDQSWVGTPADSPNVLTVGSVNAKLEADIFTSFGITTDKRMKPDVIARGGGAAVINVLGKSEFRSGTSYASPIICGLAACLWQAYPTLTNLELIDIIRKSGDRASSPVIPYGYGIANMETASALARARTKLR